MPALNALQSHVSEPCCTYGAGRPAPASLSRTVSFPWWPLPMKFALWGEGSGRGKAAQPLESRLHSGPRRGVSTLGNTGFHIWALPRLTMNWVGGGCGDWRATHTFLPDRLLQRLCLWRAGRERPLLLSPRMIPRAGTRKNLSLPLSQTYKIFIKPN